jgi:hypothetical protein
MDRAKWEITLCPTGKIHVHYQTGSSDVLRGGYLRLAQELRDVADQMAALSAQKRNRTATASKIVKA